MVVEAAMSAGTAHGDGMGGIEQMGLVVLELDQQMVTGGQGCRECFLGMHGVEGEPASGQAQSGDHVLGIVFFAGAAPTPITSTLALHSPG